MERRQGDLIEAQDTIKRLEETLKETQVAKDELEKQQRLERSRQLQKEFQSERTVKEILEEAVKVAEIEASVIKPIIEDIYA